MPPAGHETFPARFLRGAGLLLNTFVAHESDREPIFSLERGGWDTAERRKIFQDRKEARASFSMFLARNRRLLVAGTLMFSVLAISS